MPFTYRCVEHPDFRADVLDPVVAHAVDYHPGATNVGRLRREGILVAEFESMAEAQRRLAAERRKEAV